MHNILSKQTVCILLTTYNGDKYLNELLDSIFKQSYQDFIILISDDKSNDSTINIINNYIQKYPNKIIKIESNNRLGSSENFASLLSIAKNYPYKYIMFADQDDVWLSDKILNSLNKIKQCEDKYNINTPILVHTDMIVVDENLNIINKSFWKYAKLLPSKSKLLHRELIQNSASGCAMIINRALLELTTPIPNSAIQHDWWLTIVASALGKVEYITTPSILYRQHEENAVGALKYSSWSYFLKILRTPRDLKTFFQARHIKQTKEFLNIYKNKLSKYQINMIENYLDIFNKSFLNAIQTIFKYKFFLHGVSRNAITFIFKGFKLFSKKYNKNNIDLNNNINKTNNDIVYKPQLLSILIATDGRAPDLNKFFHAIANQTTEHNKYELIIVDLHNTADYIFYINKLKQNQKIDFRLEYLKFKHKSRAFAYNYAIKQARGDILLFFADDFIPPSTLVESHINYHIVNPQENYVGVGSGIIKGKKITMLGKTIEKTGDLFGIPFNLDMRNIPDKFFYSGNSSVKKSFLDKAGYFDEIYPYNTWDDYELGIRLNQLSMVAKYIPGAQAIHDHKITLRQRTLGALQSGISAKLFESKYKGPHTWSYITKQPKFWLYLKYRFWQFCYKSQKSNSTWLLLYYRAAVNYNFYIGYYK